MNELDEIDQARTFSLAREAIRQGSRGKRRGLLAKLLWASGRNGSTDSNGRQVQLLHPPDSWHPRAPVTDAALEQLVSQFPMQFPPAYLDLLRTSNGGYVELTISPWAVDFWAAEQINQLNQEYGMVRSAPNYLAFGSNLGEEMLAFHKPEGPLSGIYMLPWHAPSEANAYKVCESFKELVAAMKDADDS
jgi:hypothetical protein